ncbi:uncharacterized protein LOC120683449 [Panicum virgatum]|uniref:Ubiquitin-like protease family profile domain-containing protein n=1 Tax=Panicum virgatum TaxID=38727 RepID=A0A8T0PQQ9_PANVG|nr:uncharacterized protein LOC120683449 [Panicum virgatum]KAG2564711.1 hypothetical protein PVAP13_7NG295400 [Panicum virgatum]
MEGATLTFEEAQEIYFDTMEKAKLAYKFKLGQPLIESKELPRLPLHMRDLHQYYKLDSSTAGNSGFEVVIKADSVFHHLDEMLHHVEYEDLFQLYQRRDMGTQLMMLWSLRTAELCKTAKIKDFAFLDPCLVNELNITGKGYADVNDLFKRVKCSIAGFLEKGQTEILLTYNCSFHFVFVTIDFDFTRIEVWDSKQRSLDYVNDLVNLLNRVKAELDKEKKSHTPFVVASSSMQCLDQPEGSNECGLYAMWAMLRHIGIKMEEGNQDRKTHGHNKLTEQEIRGFQEEIANFILEHVVSVEGKYSIA